uniref:Uncharacterized protein n=1 Tax=Timema shepardi TaxID=629360 RepID=A0A7R9B041_TIMSH|nr:unnamed protein product [Timema shepardi]
MRRNAGERGSEHPAIRIVDRRWRRGERVGVSVEGEEGEQVLTVPLGSKRGAALPADTPGRPTGRHLSTDGATSRGHDAYLRRELIQIEVEQDQFDSKSIELLQRHTRYEASGVGIKSLVP